MASDYKKEYKDLYQPKRMPAIVTVPAMRFVAVDGVGDPNEEGGDYAKAMQLDNARFFAHFRIPGLT